MVPANASCVTPQPFNANLYLAACTEQDCTVVVIAKWAPLIKRVMWMVMQWWGWKLIAHHTVFVLICWRCHRGWECMCWNRVLLNGLQMCLYHLFGTFGEHLSTPYNATFDLGVDCRCVSQWKCTICVVTPTYQLLQSFCCKIHLNGGTWL